MKLKKIIILLLVFLFIGCTKNEIDINTFIDVANFNGYIISENKDEYKGYNYIKNVHYAINREGMYFIQFLELEDDEVAKRFFELNKEEFVKYKDSNTYTKTMNSMDYNLYHLETEESYKLVIRSKSNIMYIDAPIDYINEIEEFLAELDIVY